MRLDRLLASLAQGSRQEVKALIRQGQVTCRGIPLTDPAEQGEEGLALVVGGAALDTRLTRHVMMHKPAGVLTAARCQAAHGDDPRRPSTAACAACRWGGWI